MDISAEQSKKDKKKSPQGGADTSLGNIKGLCSRYSFELY